MALSAAINIKAQALNSMTEVIPFKMTDGKIIIAATVNGEPADFILDATSQGSIAIVHSHRPNVLASNLVFAMD